MPTLLMNKLRTAIDDSIYTDKAVAELIEVSPQTIYQWFRTYRDRETQRPNKKNEEKVVNIMDYLGRPENKGLKKHPSFGWARQDQIDRLNEIGICPERDQIMADITKQNKAKGKIK